MAPGAAQAARSDSLRATDPLTAKFLPPPLGPGVRTRPRLLDACSSASERRLTVVDAPTGCGKTTLLADWYRHASAREDGVIAWLSLESAENDPVLFWRYVVGALRHSGFGGGSHAETILPVPGVDLEDAVRSLLNDLAELDPRIVLVLDDYHLVREPICHRLMAALLAHAPAGFRLIISTRSDPPLPMASLRAAGQLSEIRARDLRLTADDASEYFRAAEGLALSEEEEEEEEEELTLLVARTEGWVAALQLASVWLRSEPDHRTAIRRFAGDNRHLVDYLGEQVLAGLEPPIEHFLLETSILANLFLNPLDGRRQWYRYHRLFAGLLQAELANRDPDLVPILHRRAFAWHRENGTVVEASTTRRWSATIPPRLR